MSVKKGIALGLLVFIIGLMPRLYRLDGMNNYIDDLASRQAILSLDIMKGILYLPHSPWLFEFDEAGLATLTVPIIALFGTRWIVYQAMAAVAGAITCVAILYLVTKAFGLWTGLVSSLLIATMPCMLIWDRYYHMSASEIITTVNLMALTLVIPPTRLTKIRAVMAGVMIGVLGYIATTSAFILPSIATVIVLRHFANRGRRFREMIQHLASLGAGYAAVITPLIIILIKNPLYVIWRQRHFISMENGFWEAAQTVVMSFLGIFVELFYNAQNFFYQPHGYPLLIPPISLCVIIGVVRAVTRWRQPAYAALIAFMLFWIPSFSTIKPEPWRGPYYAYMIPYMTIFAAIGALTVYESLAKWTRLHKTFAIAGLLLLTGTAGFQLYLFIAGPYKIVYRPDIITRLQLDLEGVEDIPTIFSNRIPDVDHYHYPFWFASRSRLSHVSIFDWNENGWIVPPDKEPIQFENDPASRVRIVLAATDVDEFLAKFDRAWILSQHRLERTGLIVIECHITIPDPLKRTWTETAIPPIIPFA